MQISLRLDEYVYNNRPISVVEAEKYIKEVSGYKTKGCNDVHSMQVSHRAFPRVIFHQSKDKSLLKRSKSAMSYSE